MANPYNTLFSSLISDIKSYSGKDPLLPWLRGIRKMKDTVPPHILKDKLPRFLQKCAETFLSDKRYSNDLRYLRVWLQLMDFVDDPGAVLGTMKANNIGMKMSLFYQACALYYEKMKKFEEAEKMYHLGVKNLAEPVDELQKSFEQFILRMERHKNKKIERQGRRTINIPLCAGTKSLISDGDKENNENKYKPVGISDEKSLSDTQPKFISVESKVLIPQNSRSYVKHQDGSEAEDHNKCGDDTVVVKFVDTALVGKSEAEAAWHHGLVEPTVNTKEAMNAINGMFREPLEQECVGRRSRNSQPKADQSSNNGFEVFVDENLDNGAGSSKQKSGMNTLSTQRKTTETHQSHQEPLQIFVDDEENNEMTEGGHENQRIEESTNRRPDNCNFQNRKAQKLTEPSSINGGSVSSILVTNPKGPSKSSNFLNVENKPPQARQREDTVVCRFVGSTISDEPQVENVCHHGLVEPTINLKEAMNDINSMFGKPIEFARKNRSRKQEKAPEKKRDCGGFLILPDDELDNKVGKFHPNSSSRNESDLFEQTLCTKEAMDEINKMFGMPLDF